jgi:hypothetical protein
MATSPIYSWPEPDNTDLLKNGALAIRTLGNAIDTTMGTMTPKSTFTAKGSIAAATAASTPANLSVGANDTMLVADSTAATGLAYKSATTLYPWTTYTPTISGFTIGNGSLVARYAQIGKTVHLRITFTLGSTSAVSAAPRFTLPVNASSITYIIAGSGSFGDFGVGDYILLPIIEFANQIYCALANTTATFASENAGISSTVPFTWTTNDSIAINMTYEAA